jgi:FMN reductase
VASILLLCGSPARRAGTAAVLDTVGTRLRAHGHATRLVRLRDLAPGPLLAGRTDDPGLASAIAAVRDATAVVIATPLSLGSFSGLLKGFLDVLPAGALARKNVLPVATGTAPADDATAERVLRPVLEALCAYQILPGRLVPDRGDRDDVDVRTRIALNAAVDALDGALRERGPALAFAC